MPVVDVYETFIASLGHCVKFVFTEFDFAVTVITQGSQDLSLLVEQAEPPVTLICRIQKRVLLARMVEEDSHKRGSMIGLRYLNIGLSCHHRRTLQVSFADTPTRYHDISA